MEASRYTMMLIRPDQLSKIIEAARMLGLKWFAREDDGARVAVYLFFDAVGMRYFLDGLWGDPAPDPRSFSEIGQELLEEHHDLWQALADAGKAEKDGEVCTESEVINGY